MKSFPFVYKNFKKYSGKFIPVIVGQKIVSNRKQNALAKSCQSHVLAFYRCTEGCTATFVMAS